MPNWCFTQYAIKGDQKEVTSLYNTMFNLQNRRESLLPNGFGKTWLGNLVHALDNKPEAIECRGDWDANSLELSDDGTLLKFNTETAWARCNEVETMLSLRFGDHISIYYYEEEDGMGVFRTNDAAGEFFPDQVIIEDEQLDEREYFTNDAALAWLADRLEIDSDNPSWEKVSAALIRRNELAEDSNNNTHIYVKRIEIDED